MSSDLQKPWSMNWVKEDYNVECWLLVPTAEFLFIFVRTPQLCDRLIRAHESQPSGGHCKVCCKSVASLCRDRSLQLHAMFSLTVCSMSRIRLIGVKTCSCVMCHVSCVVCGAAFSSGGHWSLEQCESGEILLFIITRTSLKSLRLREVLD